MTTVTKALMNDHRKVERLFSKFESSGNPEIAREICAELKIHTTLEEELVYPILREKVDRSLAKEAEQEHDEADNLIRQIEGSMGDKARLTNLMTQLKAAVEHHVSEEEDEVFPKMDRQAANDLESISDEFMQRKQAMTGGAGREDLEQMTKDQLYKQAAAADIPGRSNMNKDELVDALADS